MAVVFLLGPGMWAAEKTSQPERAPIEVRRRLAQILKGGGHSAVLMEDVPDLPGEGEEGPGGPATLRAKWTKEGALEVRIKPDEGEKRTESYVDSNDGEHLYLTIVFSGRGDFPLRLAYDRVQDVPAEPPSPEP